MRERMQIVIDISEEDYKRISTIVDMGLGTNIDEAIKNGTPLPKNHGRLIDADKLVYDCSLGGGGCDHICRCDGCSYNIIREHTINEAPTIIEADKENKGGTKNE